MTNSFNEFAKAKMLIVIGSNMTEAHPVASTYVKNAVANGAQLIVVDPRKHKLCDFAALHLPLKVGSDIALLNAIMHVLITEDLHDRRFVESCTIGFDALKEKVIEYPPERVADNILKAIQRNRAVAPISPEAWTAYYLKRLAPWAVAAFGRWMNARMRREFGVTD